MIALYKGISRFSRAVRWLTRSEYSHASWVDPELGGNWEAWIPGGVRAMETLHDGHMTGTVVDLFDDALSGDEIDAIRAFMRSQNQKPYDYLGCLHFVTRRPERPADQERWFCSELVAAAFAKAGRPLLVRIPAWKIYPAMLSYSPRLSYIETIVTQ